MRPQAPRPAAASVRAAVRRGMVRSAMLAAGRRHGAVVADRLPASKRRAIRFVPNHRAGDALHHWMRRRVRCSQQAREPSSSLVIGLEGRDGSARWSPPLLGGSTWPTAGSALVALGLVLAVRLGIAVAAGRGEFLGLDLAGLIAQLGKQPVVLLDEGIQPVLLDAKPVLGPRHDEGESSTAKLFRALLGVAEQGIQGAGVADLDTEHGAAVGDVGPLVTEQVDDLPEQIAIGQRPGQPATAGEPRLERFAALGPGRLQLSGPGPLRLLTLPAFGVLPRPPLGFLALAALGLLGRRAVAVAGGRRRTALGGGVPRGRHRLRIWRALRATSSPSRYGRRRICRRRGVPLGTHADRVELACAVDPYRMAGLGAVDLRIQPENRQAACPGAAPAVRRQDHAVLLQLGHDLGTSLTALLALQLSVDLILHPEPEATAQDPLDQLRLLANLPDEPAEVDRIGVGRLAGVVRLLEGRELVVDD